MPEKPNLWVAEPCNRDWDETSANCYFYAKGKHWKGVSGLYYGADPDFWPVFLTPWPSRRRCGQCLGLRRGREVLAGWQARQPRVLPARRFQRLHADVHAQSQGPQAAPGLDGDLRAEAITVDVLPNGKHHGLNGTRWRHVWRDIRTHCSATIGDQTMNTRREFVQGLAAAVGGPLLVAGAASAQPTGRAADRLRRRLAVPLHPEPRPSRRTSRSPSWTRRSPTGRRGSARPGASCWNCCTTPRPRAILAPRSSSGWTAATTSARGCSSTPRPTCACRPTSWCPRRPTGPLPAVVALHDHGGFYLWGKEKLVETDDEHPVLTDFKKRLLRRHAASPRTWPGRATSWS